MKQQLTASFNDFAASLTDDESRQIAHALLATYQQPDWHKLEARMQAFASEPVITAMQVSSTAHMKALAAHKSWDATSRRILPVADSEGAAAETVEDRQALDRAKDALDTARTAAEKADDARHRGNTDGTPGQRQTARRLAAPFPSLTRRPPT